MAFVYFRCSASTYDHAVSSTKPPSKGIGKKKRIYKADNLSKTTISLPLRIFAYFACLFLMVTVAYSRLYLHYHSLDQVLVGIVIGGLFGLLWQIIYHYHFLHSTLYQTISNSYLCQKFYIKDYSNIPNVLVFEYENLQRFRDGEDKQPWGIYSQY